MSRLTRSEYPKEYVYGKTAQLKRIKAKRDAARLIVNLRTLMLLQVPKLTKKDLNFKPVGNS